MRQESSIDNSVLDLLPRRKETCLVFKNVFSKEECEDLLEQAETVGFKSADDKYPTTYRNNERLQEDNSTLANYLYQKVCCQMPQKIETEAKSYVIAGLNDRLRYCKYSKDQSFSIHQDGVFYRNGNEESVLTFLLYLNDSSEYLGGETSFFSSKSGDRRLAEYRGDAGDVIVFDHKLWHSGQPVLSGQKYILRSDFIYRVTEQRSLNLSHHDGYVWKVISLSGNLIASASRDRSIRIWSESLVLKQTLSCHENSVLDIASSESLLFSVSRDGFLGIWSQEEHGFELKEKVNTFHSSVLNVSLCGESVITSGADGYIRIWSKQGILLNSVKVTEGWVWKTLMVSEDIIIACTSNGELVEVDITSARIAAKAHLNESIRCAVSLEDRMFVGGESGAIYELDIPTLSALKNMNIHEGIIRDIQTDGQNIISCGEDGKIIELCPLSGRVREIYVDANFLTSLCWKDERTIFSSSYSGSIDMHVL